jgi:hypothetical protein
VSQAQRGVAYAVSIRPLGLKVPGLDDPRQPQAFGVQPNRLTVKLAVMLSDSLIGTDSDSDSSESLSKYLVGWGATDSGTAGPTGSLVVPLGKDSSG